MFRHSVCAALVMCVVAVGFTNCRSQEATPTEDSLPPSGGATTKGPLSPEPSAPTVTRKGAPATGDGAWVAGADDRRSDELSWAEIDARMSRPIEESIYDPTLTKDQKHDLLLRHYSLPGNHVFEPDHLMDAVMSEGMTELEAAKYWAVEGGSHKWAIHHAEAALRSDPGSVEALALWAQELPLDRGVERQAAFMAVLERDPTHYAALISLANTTAMEQPYESIEYAKRLIDVHPDSGHAYKAMGQAYERLGDPDTAASYYEAGIEVAPQYQAVRVALDFLNSGYSTIQPIEAAQGADDPVDLPDPPTSAPVQPSPRAPAPQAPVPPRETPEPVERYQNALNEYRVMAGRFENVTGRQYQGVQDFGDYPEESSNWMAWRYMELGQQYLDAGHPEEAANVFRSATRQFPDDALIRQRGEQMERSR